MASRLLVILFALVNSQIATKGFIKDHTSTKEVDDKFHTSQLLRYMDGTRLTNPDLFDYDFDDFVSGRVVPKRPGKDCFLTRLTFDSNNKPYLINRIEIQLEPQGPPLGPTDSFFRLQRFNVSTRSRPYA